VQIWYVDSSGFSRCGVLIGGSESSSGCQNNIPIAATVSKEVEHFHPPFCEAFLAPLTFWDVAMKLPWGSQGKEMFRDLPWGSLVRLQEQNAGLTTSIWQCGGILPVLRDRLKN